MLHSVTGDYLKVALHGLSLQRQTSTDNLANMETPGYLAKRVDFESALRKAFERGNGAVLDIDRTTSNAPTAQNGNNVAVDDELLIMSDNSLRQQLVVESLNARYRVLRTSIGGQ